MIWVSRGGVGDMHWLQDYANNTILARISRSSKHPGQWCGQLHHTDTIYYRDTEAEIKQFMELLVNLEGLV